MISRCVCLALSSCPKGSPEFFVVLFTRGCFRSETSLSRAQLIESMVPKHIREASLEVFGCVSMRVVNATGHNSCARACCHHGSAQGAIYTMRIEFWYCLQRADACRGVTRFSISSQIRFEPVMAQSDEQKAQSSGMLGTTYMSRTFYQFMNPVISMARSTEQLQEDAVPQHTMDLDTKLLYETFEAERIRQQEMKSPSIWKALMAGRWGLFLTTAVGYLFSQGLSLAGPLLLKQIVQGLTCRDTPGKPGCDGSERRLYM